MTIFKGNNNYKMKVFGEQTYSRLTTGRKRAFSPVGNYSSISEAGGNLPPALYNEVRI